MFGSEAPGGAGLSTRVTAKPVDSLTHELTKTSIESPMGNNRFRIDLRVRIMIGKVSSKSRKTTTDRGAR